MKYKTIDKKSYQLHLIKTDRFKTITIRVNMRSKMKKHEISLRNFLLDMLIYSTENYPTRRELVEKTQDLYAVNLYGKCYRTGNYNSMNLFASFLNEKYTEDGMTEESIRLLSEVLFHPNVRNQEFDLESFQVIKHNNETMLKSIKDNPQRYSLIRMLENMQENEDDAYSYREYGYLEDLENITPSNLYQYYKEVLRTSLVDIYVIGNFDEKQMIEWMDKYMEFHTLKTPKEDIMISFSKARKKPQIIKEKEHFNQSKLSIGCKLIGMDERERNYVLTLYNIMLGNGGDSRFFKNIREKYSLCYYMNSSVNKLDNLLLIRSGIQKENFEECIRLIKQEMKEIEKGNFGEEELEAAKKTYITLLDEIYDNQEAIIETYIAKELLGIGDIEERKQEITSVVKEEIIALSKKVHLDTIYLLEGDMEDEQN